MALTIRSIERPDGTLATIDEPGVYRVLAEVYHADKLPPAPSLSSSGARKIIAECPARYWWDRNHPPEPSDAMNVGTAAHEWILEGEAWPQRFTVLPSDHDGRSAAGKARVREIVDAGKRPIKWDDWQAIKGMRDALLAHDFAGAAFQGGQAEMSLYWRDEDFGIWCRARPDYLPERGTILADYKTCRSAEPEALRRSIAEYGYHMQAAWYCDGVKALGLIQTPTFVFVFQEKDPPYLVTCVTLTAEALAAGDLLNRQARYVFARCLRTGIWPGYADDVLALDLPAWAQKRIQDKADRGEFDIDNDWQRPLEGDAAA